jgi:uncharacterized repeat protein (TIGR01451 family)/gliding motility-associated-like protein
MKQTSTGLRLLDILSTVKVFFLYILFLNPGFAIAAENSSNLTSASSCSYIISPDRLKLDIAPFFQSKSNLSKSHFSSEVLGLRRKLTEVSCQDSLITRLPTRAICAGEEFEIGVEFQSKNDVLWFTSPTGGVPFDTTKFGEKTRIVLNASAQYYLQSASLDSACTVSRVPISLLVNLKPSLPMVNDTVFVCQDSLIALNKVLLNAPDNLENTFGFYTDSLKRNKIDTLTGSGKYYVFQESIHGCSSLAKEFSVVTKVCEEEALVDLSLVKSANKRTVTIGEEIEYSITLKNATLNHNATNVEVTDILPDGLGFVSSTDFVRTGDTLKLKIDTVYANTSKAYLYRAKAEKVGNVVNFAEITKSDQADPNSTPGNGVDKNEDDDDDEAIVVIEKDTTIQTADLSLLKKVNKQAVNRGENVLYTITVTNSGPHIATNVHVSDTLPAGLSYIRTIGGETVTLTGKTVLAKFDSIAVNTSKEFVIEARADSLGQIINRAEVVKSDQKDPDSTPGSGVNEDDDDTVTIIVLQECGSLSVPLISTARNYICSGETITLMAVGCTNVIWSTGQTGASIQVNPIVNTTYTAACFSGECKGRSSNALLVSMTSTAKPTVTASTKNICFGEEVILTAAGCSDQVKWSNGENGKTLSVFPDKTTKYTAQCEGGSCSGNVSNELEIIVNTTRPNGVTAVDFIRNTCPQNFVNLNSAILTQPAQTTLVFKNGTLPSSSDADSLIYEKGLFYVFAKHANGCLSTSTPITVDIEACEVGTADLSINLIVDKEEAVVGDTLSMRFVVNNAGPDSVPNSEVVSTLFKGFSLLQGQPGLGVAGEELKWNVRGLSTNQKDSLSFKLKVNEPGVYKLKANVHSSDIDDPNLANNESVNILKVLSRVPCIAAALNADTLKLNDSTYHLTLSTYVMNCGSQSISSVKASLNLAELLTEPLTYTLQGGVSVNPASSLIGNESFDGKTSFDLLAVGSSLDVGDVDTITVKYSIVPNGVNKVFNFNTLVYGEYGAGELITDTSNNGETIIRNLSTPTSASFGSSSGLASILNVKSVVVTQPGVNKITFQAVLKNNDTSSISSIVISDSLSKYFRSPATFTVSDLKSSGSLVANSAFNGISDPKLTLGNSSLAAGAIDTLEFAVTLSKADTTVYYNQLQTSAVVGGDAVAILSNWSSDINEPGNLATRVELDEDSINDKEDYCIGLGLSAVEKLWQADGSINITYKATIGNCGKKQVRNVSLCDLITDGISDSATVTLLAKPKVNTASHLFLNPDFNGISETCIFKSELSYLDSAAVDTVWYTVKVVPHESQYVKSLKLEATADSTDSLSVISNDGLLPFIFDEIPTIVMLDSTFNTDLLGLAKQLIGIDQIEEDVFDVEFRFVVKNYSDATVTNLQIQDDLSVAFGEDVSIENIRFSKVPENWTVNSEFSGVGDDKNLLLDSQSTISAFSTQGLNLKVRLKLNSRNTLVFENFGLVIGKIKNGVVSLDDISTDGSNPDSNFSGSPLDDSLATVIDFRHFYSGKITTLGIAKSGLAELTSTGGTRISYAVVVKNYGTEELKEINLIDDLKKVFDRNTQYVLLTGPDVNENSTLQPNQQFNGTTDVDLLAEGSKLEAGKADTIWFSVGVFNTNDVSQTYRNQIIGTAIYSGEEVMDLSVSGDNPDADGDGNPGNDSGYTINVVDPGVIDSTEVRIIVTEGISPNGDGINDEWLIQDEGGSVSLSRMGKLKVEIVNRWGHPVYKSDDYASDFADGKGWKGQANVGVILSKGSVLPDGTYFYSISSSEAWVFGGRKKVGYITLKR